MIENSPKAHIHLDSIDIRIAKELAANARLTIVELSNRVGLSKTPVLGRIRRLESTGVITGYHAAISSEKLGLSHISFVEVRLSDTRGKSLRDFNAAVAEISEVVECHMIAGGFDYLLKVRTKDIEAYRIIMSEKISELPFVASTSSYVAMETVKAGSPDLD